MAPGLVFTTDLLLAILGLNELVWRWPAALGGLPAQMATALFFFAWNPRLFRGSVDVPKRTYVLFAVVTVLSSINFYSNWNDGLQVQGGPYTFTVLTLNIVCIMGLGTIFVRSRNKEPSFANNLLLHWSLFAWLAWFALPFLGAPTYP